jgi:hypothetical protein
MMFNFFSSRDVVDFFSEVCLHKNCQELTFFLRVCLHENVGSLTRFYSSMVVKFLFFGVLLLLSGLEVFVL